MKGTNSNQIRDLIPCSRWRLDADKLLLIPRYEQILLSILISMLSLTIFLALFVFRRWDDNRLTSWQWVFADLAAYNIFLLLVFSMVLAYLFSYLSMPVRKTAFWSSIGLFIAAFGVSAAFWRTPEIIVDASRYFIQAKSLELYGITYFLQEWGNEISVWTDLPLIPLLYGLIFKIFGEYRIAIQIFNSLLFSATVVLTYHLGKSLWQETVGLYAAVLLLAIPYLLTQVPLMLVDVATMFFFTLALFATINAVKHGGVKRLILASITIVLAMLSKYSVWLMLSVIPIIFLSYIEIGWKIIAQRAAALTLVTVLLGGIFLLWKFDIIAQQLNLLQNYQVPGLKRWGESFASTFFFQTHPYISLAALFSVYPAIKNRDSKYAIISWLLLLVVVLEINRARYLVVIFPMLVLMAAYGINEINNAKIGSLIVSTSVVSALAIATFGYLPFLQYTSSINLTQAGKYLDGLNTTNVMNTETIEVVALPQVRSMVNPAVTVAILDLLTQKKLLYQYDQDQIQPPNSIEKSSLRFSWEYNNPKFFLADNKTSNSTPLVIVYGDIKQIIPAQIAQKIESYRLDKEFNISDKVFKYQTMIRVYLPV